eukprot:jgi/Astpho2/2078/Aster-x0079
MASANIYTISNISLETIKDADLDPQVVFHHSGTQKVKTSVAKSAGVSARWSETVDLQVASGQGAPDSDVCIVDVENHNALLPDGHIGSATFRLGSGQTQRLTLLNKKGKETGTLVFSVAGGSLSAGNASANTCSTSTCGTTTTSSEDRLIGAQGGACAARTTGADGPICEQKHFTKVEDRPVTKEITTQIREHHPIEKEFVVETRPTGKEHEQADKFTSEVIDSRERVVAKAQANPCAGVPTAQVQ